MVQYFWETSNDNVLRWPEYCSEMFKPCSFCMIVGCRTPSWVSPKSCYLSYVRFWFIMCWCFMCFSACRSLECIWRKSMSRSTILLLHETNQAIIYQTICRLGDSLVHFKSIVFVAFNMCVYVKQSLST